MRGRRLVRFAIEALFLGALAAALTVADVSAPAIAGVMLLGWLVVALYEWATTRELPHYGRGLPPRYYVPQVALPPPRPLEQLSAGYPAGTLDEEPTWIASPAMRAEMLPEWPVAAGVTASPSEDTIVDGLPFVSTPEEHREDTSLDLEAGDREDPLKTEQVAAFVAVPEVVEEPEPAGEPGVVDEPEPATVGVAEPDVETEPAVAEEEPGEIAAAAERPARHTFDPLAGEGPTRRRWRRQAGRDQPFAEFPARPPRAARLPGRLRHDD